MPKIVNGEIVPDQGRKLAQAQGNTNTLRNKLPELRRRGPPRRQFGTLRNGTYSTGQGPGRGLGSIIPHIPQKLRKPLIFLIVILAAYWARMWWNKDGTERNLPRCTGKDSGWACADNIKRDPRFAETYSQSMDSEHSEYNMKHGGITRCVITMYASLNYFCGTDVAQDEMLSVMKDDLFEHYDKWSVIGSAEERREKAVDWMRHEYQMPNLEDKEDIQNLLLVIEDNLEKAKEFFTKYDQNGNSKLSMKEMFRGMLGADIGSQISEEDTEWTFEEFRDFLNEDTQMAKLFLPDSYTTSKTDIYDFEKYVKNREAADGPLPLEVISFRISQPLDAAVGHVFVMQAMTDGTYFLYQSFISHYTLVEYVEKHAGSQLHDIDSIFHMDYQGITEFVRKVKLIVTSSVWTGEVNQAYLDMFGVDMLDDRNQHMVGGTEKGLEATFKSRVEFDWNVACAPGSKGSSADEMGKQSVDDMS